MSRPRAVLDQLNIVVKDMARAVDFYTRLGLEVPSTLPVWQGHHRTVEGAGLDVDLDSAAFARHWNQGWPAGAAGVVLGFRVASLMNERPTGVRPHSLARAAPDVGIGPPAAVG